MKKLYIIAVSAFGMLNLAGCQNTIDEPAAPQGQYKYTITAGAATKTVLDGTTVKWSATDCLGLFTDVAEQTAPVQYSHVSGAGSSSAVFGTNTSFSGTPAKYYAVYPYDETDTFDPSTEILSVSLPAKQTYVANSFGTDANPAVGYSTNDSFTFHNLCGVLKLQLTGTKTVMRIEILADKQISGAVTVSGIAAGTPTIATSTMPIAAQKQVILDCGSAGITLTDTATPFNIVLPAAEYALTVKVYTSDGLVSENTANVTVAKAEIKPMASLAPSFANYYYGSANSIIVAPEATSLTVDAAPHTTTDAAYAYDNTTTPSTSVVSADLIWQDAQSLIASVSYDATDKQIDITKAGGTAEGNALVALRNAAGDVLWSFHIWVTDTPVDLQYKKVSTSANTYKMMDRNLGAYSVEPQAVSSLGLNYQWGRKDPFIYASSTVVGTRAESPLYDIDNATASVTKLAPTDDNTTIYYASTNPFVYTYQPAEGGLASGWASTHADHALWGNPTGYAASAGQYPRGTKSVYDPCPAGYSVPPMGVWSFSEITASSIDGESNLESDLGYNLKYDGINTTWYPACGCRQSNFSSKGRMDSIGKNGYYWTNVAHSTNNTYYAYVLNGVTTNGYGGMIGFEVRCCKIE